VTIVGGLPSGEGDRGTIFGTAKAPSMEELYVRDFSAYLDKGGDDSYCVA